MIANKERNSHVDIIRGIAILLVVLGHTMTGCTLNSQDSFLFNIVWSLQMPLFILISGYVTRYSKKISSGGMLWSYVKRRTMAYLLPWTVWTFLVRGILLGRVEYFNFKTVFWNMDSGYWFLISIWTISLILGVSSYLANRITSKKNCSNGNLKDIIFTGIFYVVGMALLAAVGLALGLSFFCIKLTLYYMPFYFVGYIYGKLQDKINEKAKGRWLTQIVVAVSLFAWLAIILRISLYSISDSGMGILVRAFASLTGCIAVCGVISPLFSNNQIGGGSFIVVWDSFTRNIYCPLLLSNSDEARNDDKCKFHFGDNHNSSELCCNDYTNSSCDKAVEYKPHSENIIIRKNTISETISNALHWAGTHSLEIYLLHGLLLNVIKTSMLPEFTTWQGCLLVFINYILTLLLTCCVIEFLGQNKVLKKVLF